MLLKACNAQTIHIRTYLYKIIVFKKEDIFYFKLVIYCHYIILTFQRFLKFELVSKQFYIEIRLIRVYLNIISRMFICFIILSLQTNLQNNSSHQIICPRSFPVTSVVVPLSYLLSCLTVFESDFRISQES